MWPRETQQRKRSWQSSQMGQTIEMVTCEAISMSSSLNDDTRKKKFILVARKSTCPFKVIINNKPSVDRLEDANILTGKSQRDDFYIRDQVLDTGCFIDSFLLDKNKLVKLNELEKPIKVYSYIGLRQRYHPIFLNKNFNLLGKKFKTICLRKNFKLDDILNTKMLTTHSNYFSFKLDKILIHKKEDTDFISLNIHKLNSNEALSIRVCVTIPSECVLLKNIESKNIKVSHQNGLVEINLFQTHFITLDIDFTQSVHKDEMDYDSDSEMDSEWLKELTELLISDFADVNEGEKEIMKLWSLNCIKYNLSPTLRCTLLVNCS
ncbi:polycomb suz12-B [Brachionus plicatilis]|uniref:Polycomb suz12-B n=1 Tax=Brachionus plicatilis TaxID=10195 RepID=A0A3M7SZD1_BRAPC|nr:polycomb suz12-B [Brachionus plicatilis]